MSKPRKKKTIARGVARGLGKLGKGIVSGVAGELAAILTLGLYRPSKRK